MKLFRSYQAHNAAPKSHHVVGVFHDQGHRETPQRMQGYAQPHHRAVARKEPACRNVGSILQYHGQEAQNQAKRPELDVSNPKGCTGISLHPNKRHQRVGRVSVSPRST